MEFIDTEIDSMQIIMHAGNAKSNAYEALIAVKGGDYVAGDAKMKSAKEEILIAHRAHAELLRKLADADHMRDVDLLMVHAEGHLSATAIAVDLIVELCNLHKKIEGVNE